MSVITGPLLSSPPARFAENTYLLSAMAASMDAILTLDATHRVVHANRAVIELLGYTPEDLTGTPMSTLIHPPLGMTWTALARQVCEAAAPMKVHAVQRDGTLVPIILSASAITDEANPGCVCVLRDISEHRTVELALWASENRCRSVVENVKEVIFQTDETGRWTFLNPAWTEVTGFSIEESLGKPFLDFVYPDDRAGNIQKFQPLIAREKQTAATKSVTSPAPGSTAGSKSLHVSPSMDTGAASVHPAL